MYVYFVRKVAFKTPGWTDRGLLTCTPIVKGLFTINLSQMAMTCLTEL